MRYIVVFQVREHNAAAVYHAHILCFFLGTHHNDGRKDADACKKDRGKECDKEEALLLYLVKVFTLDYYS